MFSNMFASYNLVKPPEGVEQELAVPSFDEDISFNNFETPYSFIKQEDKKENDKEDKPEIVKPPFKKEEKKKEVKLKGSAQFEKAFNEALKIDPSIARYKNFLVRTAKRESGFNSHIQNTTGAPYYGYFQMGQKEIKATTGLTVEQFRNDPVKQILGAVNLYKLNLKSLKALGVYDVGRNKGYTEEALIAGCWLAGAGGVKKFLLGKGDPSDSHWYGNSGGGYKVSKLMKDWMNNKI